MTDQPEYAFDHERMDVYRLAVEVARSMNDQKWPSGRSSLRDQATRAIESVVLNLAEGFGRGGGASRNHFRIARGSAAEVCAVLDLVQLQDREALQAQLRRIGAMTRRLAK